MGIQHKGQTLKLAEQHLCQPYWKSSIEQHISSWSSQRPLEMLLLLLTYPLWDQDHARSSDFRVPDRLIRTQCGVSARCNPTCSEASDSFDSDASTRLCQMDSCQQVSNYSSAMETLPETRRCGSWLNLLISIASNDSVSDAASKTSKRR